MVVDKSQERYHLYRLLRFDQFCSYQENLHNCDAEDSRSVGPIKHEDDAFYLSQNKYLESKRYEFHSKKLEKPSFVYWLHNLKHIRLETVIDYLETDLSLYDGSMGLMLSAADSLREIDNVKIGDDSDINAPYDH